MQRVNGSADWTATVNVAGPGVVYIAQTPLYQEDANDVPRPLALYTAKKTVRVTFNATWTGSPLVPGSITINGHPGTSYVRDVTLERSLHGPYGYEIGSFLLTLRAAAIVPPSTEGGEETYLPFETQFLFETRFYKPLAVDLTNTVGSFSRRITTNRLTPRLYRDPNTGYDKVIAQLDDWPDVGVQLVPGEGASTDQPGWQRTDDYGAFALRLFASSSLFNDPERPGWARVDFKLRAVKDGIEVESDDFDYVPHAVVKNAHRVWHVGSSGGIGDLGDPVLPPMTLQPGDTLQVGTRLLEGFLDVEFHNGQCVSLQATATEGFRAVVGASSLIRGKPLVWLDLRGVVQDLQDNPRRCLRMLVYKQLGNVVDTTLGTPDPVGWVTETPGGKVEKWLADWAEQAYGPVPSPPLKSSGLREAMLITTSAGSEADARVATTARTSFDFYTDGTVWVENRGAPVALVSEAGPSTVLPPAAATFIQVDASDSEQLSSTATGTAAWTAPTPGPWQFYPTPSSFVTTRTPALSIANDVPAAFLWETATVRLDGRDLTTTLAVGTSGPDHDVVQFSGGLPASAPLRAGTHRLSIELLTASGERAFGYSDFTVAAPPAAAPAPQATPFAGGVWLAWEPVPGAAAYRIWRAASADGPRTLLNPARLRTQPGFLDDSPLSENVYWIESLDADGQAAAPTHYKTVTWDASHAAVLPPVETTELRVTDEAAGLRLEFDSSGFATTRWRIERGLAPAGPFVELAPDEETIVDGFIDHSAPVATAVYYRVSVLSLEGTDGDTMVFGPFMRSAAPLTPLGLAALPSGTSLVFTWDPALDPRLANFCLYRDEGVGFTLLATIPAHTTTLTLPAAAKPSRYALAGVSANGSESPLGVPIGAVARHTVASEPARFAFATDEIRVREGQGVATLSVTRTGNLSEPGIVSYTTVHRGDAPGIAQPHLDYTPVGGTLLFAPGVTTRQFSVPLLADALNEWAESFDVRLTANFGANEVSAELGTTRLFIEESDVLVWADHVHEMMVAENDTAVVVGIDRVWPSGRTIGATLALASDPGTARPGVDYTAFTGIPVTFAANEVRAWVRIPLLDDAEKDGERTLQLVLTNPTGGASIGSSEYPFTLRIRDNETQPGQLRPLDAARVVNASSDTLDIPLTRVGGADGSLGAYVMIDGGRLPYGTVRAETTWLNLEEGATDATVRLTLDRSQLGPHDAPFAIVQVLNSVYPFEHSRLLVIFPANPSAPDFSAWADTFGFGGARSSPLEDQDGDRVTNLVELATLSDPSDPSSLPAFAFESDGSSLSLYATVVPHPRLAVVGEFASSLEWTDPIFVGGWWEWDEERGAYRAEFWQWFPESTPRRFGRIRFLWLHE